MTAGLPDAGFFIRQLAVMTCSHTGGLRKIMARADTSLNAPAIDALTGRGKSLFAAAVRLAFACIAAGLLLSANAAAQDVPAACPADLDTANIVAHDFQVSFCELCDIGTVRLVIENPYRPRDDADFSDIVISDDLMISGLTYLPGTTRFNATNIAPPPLVEPVISGANGSVLTWNLSDQFVMPAQAGGGGNRAQLEIEFNVRRHAAVGEEGLVGANRLIEGAAEFTPSCDVAYRNTSTTGPGLLPLREPEPQIIKTARNLDAGQDAGSYSDPVYGHENDDIIWRIQVLNNGLADLQDFKFSDAIQPGNFEIDFICDAEADANSAASGGAVGNCKATGGVAELLGQSTGNLFGGGPAPYIAAPAGGSGFYYLVGRVTDSCSNRMNSVFDTEWGCEIEAPPGGIAATSLGLTAQDDALLSTLSLTDSLDVSVALTGTNTSQPMGSKGTVTITIANNTGGTVIGGDIGLRLQDTLPAEYVVDPTFDPVVQMAPAYGNAYPGMLDTIEWTNPQPDTFPLATNNPALPLGNTTPEFRITSSGVHPDFADQFNMLRHGDVLTVTFRTVLIDPQYYDIEADIDVRTERPNSDPPDTDPTESFAISNQLEIWFEEFCTPDDVHYLAFNDNDDAEPEDIDVNINGNELIFILTNDDELTLSVELRNNGGHDADDYFAYVTFGAAMVVQNAPGSCFVTANPPAMPVWQLPVALLAVARGIAADGNCVSVRTRCHRCRQDAQVAIRRCQESGSECG